MSEQREHPMVRALRERRERMKREGLPCLLCDRREPCEVCKKAFAKAAAAWDAAYAKAPKK